MNRQSVCGVALVAAALVAGVGWAADSSAGPVLVYAVRCDRSGQDASRQPVGRWMTALSDTARRLRGQSSVVVVNEAVVSVVLAAGVGEGVAASGRIEKPRTVALASLANIPPPGVSSFLVGCCA